MTPLEQLQTFTQSVYLVVKGRYFDGIPVKGTDQVLDSDGILLMAQAVDWSNMFIDELENETTPDGQPLDWKWLWQLDSVIGTVSQGEASIALPRTANNLLADQNRYVQITQDGTVVSNWAVVSPEQITNNTNRVTEDMCSQINQSIIFSRAFRDYEDGGTVTADVTTSFPRIAYNVTDDGTFSVTNIKLLTTVRPKSLLVLGVAKNASLPDIVQGGLSPSYAQKYSNLLAGAIARNGVSSRSDEVSREDLSGVAGVY